MMKSSGSSGMRVPKTGSDTGAVEEVSLSPDSLTRSSVVFGLRKLTTLVFFLRRCDLECLPAPSVRPLVADCMLTSEGLEGKPPWPSSEPLLKLLKVYVVLEPPSEEFDLSRLGVAGVEDPAESLRSDGPAHALKTASRIDGVNSDKVRWESVSAANRSKFFCENSE